MQAADEYADAVEEQLHASKRAWRWSMTQFVIAATLAFVMGGGLVLAFTGGSGPSQSIQTVTRTAPADAAAATVTAVPSAAPDTFTAMPCAPGKWVAFLASETGAYASYLAARELAIQTERAKSLPGASALNFGASRWDEICPTAREYATSDENRTFVWTGPFDSRSEVQQACRILQRPAEYDCLTKPLGTP